MDGLSYLILILHKILFESKNKHVLSVFKY